MENVKVAINPTEIKSVKYLNNFNVKSGDKINLQIKNEVGTKIDVAGYVLYTTADSVTGEEKEVPIPSLSEEYTELIDLYSKLSKDNQIAIMQIIRNLK